MAAWPSPGVVVAASLVFGPGVGNLITLPLLAREEFSQRSFGTVFGLVGAATQVGVAVGPGLVGLLRDALGSYQPALWCLVGLECLAVGSVLRVEPSGTPPTGTRARTRSSRRMRWPGRVPGS
ncbi:MAG TPA: hypothetical protein VLK35_20885 [Methylomirabilota bacterium]|nr:hypothetical protein [Methylomirabilota bacterium]